ncbi:hypothetical protein Aperf_G00000040766 [Anoplocephala perfoliata]
MTLMTSTLKEQIPTIMIMLGIFCSIGCIGNAIVIVIYATKHDRLTSTVFILTLAMVDSFACICLMPLTMYIESVEWRIQSEFLCKFYYVINNSFIPFSSLLISGIAFDRYFAICHPYSKIITVSRAKQIIVLMLSLALILGGVSSMTIVVRANPVSNDSLPEYECTETRMLNTTKAQIIIYHIVQGSQISSYVVCILSVVILYVLIFRSVLIMREKRTRLIGSRLRNLPTISEKANFSNANTDIEATAEHSPLRPIVEKPSPAGGPGNGNEQNLISEIWEKKLNASENTSAPIISPNDKISGENTEPSLVNYRSTSLNRKTNEKTTGRTWFCIRKPKFNRQHSQRVSKRSFKRMAILQNMKTAAVLFVVAIVYIIALIPAMLMAIGVIHMYLPIFYMYYVNNAINPIIYCFMNPAFREDVQNFFTSRIRKRHKVPRKQ